MKLLNHVQIKVSNLEKNKKFYDSIMEVLGYNIVLQIDNTVIGYGTSPHDMLEIRQATEGFTLSQSVHIAFNAPSKEAVDNFYHRAIDNGAQCNGKPGLREYEDGYYAAFVIDPNGHNLEAVYKQNNG
jgi:predicted lactoylglutathione lyase